MSARHLLAHASRRDRASGLIALVWLAYVGAFLAAWVRVEPVWELDRAAGVAILLVISSWFGSANWGRVALSTGHLVFVAAAALVGPVGAGIAGALLPALQRGSMPMRARLYNMAMFGLAGLSGGLTYHLLGGVRDASELAGASELLPGVGWPLLAADAAQAVANALLLALVMRVTDHVPMRDNVQMLFLRTGPAYLGYFILAFLLICLWQPVGLGWPSAILIFAPLLGVWWALQQFSEEVQSRDRTVDVLVAALEAKVPHLEGHSARVAALAGGMAEELGMGPTEVADIRTAGMLHDLGQVTLDHDIVETRGAEEWAEEYLTYPRRGVELLRGLSFLSGSLDGIALHRTPPPPQAIALGSRPWTSGQIVHLADSYDLLTTGIGIDRERRSTDEVLKTLRSSGDSVRSRLVDALERSLARSERQSP